MAVPKYRTSKSKRNMRRSHHALSPVNVGTCPNCNEVKLPHTVCQSCGFYRGAQVMSPSSRLTAMSDTFNTDI